MFTRTPMHFVRPEAGRRLRPLCGDWNGSRHWTNAPDAVSCRACLVHLEVERAAAALRTAARAE